jgi:hypothetical protein
MKERLKGGGRVKVAVLAGGRRKDVRHEIEYERKTADNGMVLTRALCSCGRFASPEFWSRQKAEAAGEDHILGLGNNGKKGEK